MKTKFTITNLKVSRAGKVVLSKINLAIVGGQVAALMGPNGSGKSTLAHAISGQPGIKIIGGKITLNGVNLTRLPADERARRGVGLSWQQPVAIPGLSLYNLLAAIYRAKQIKISQKKAAPFFSFYQAELVPLMKRLGVDEKFLERNVNEEFSGGEKRKSELLQLFVLQPRLLILDEIDSGLDVDALKKVALAINFLVKKNRGQLAVLVITHYQRILKYLVPARVHLLQDGTIIKSGNKNLASQLEKYGYQKVK